jgi:hypothetical protein
MNAGNINQAIYKSARDNEVNGNVFKKANTGAGFITIS